MSKPFIDLKDRVAALEVVSRLPQRTGRNVHNDARIERLRKQVEELEKLVPTPARLGTIVANQVVTSSGTFSFDSAYPAGGESFPIPGMPGTVSVLMPGTQAHTFSYDSGSGKMVAYDAGGGEVGDGTDLSTFIDLPYIVTGTIEPERLAFRARESMLLHSVQVEVGADFTLNASNYWTLTLVKRTSSGERLELGTPLSLQSRSLAADTLVTMYLPDEPLPLDDYDTIHVEIAETGTPAYLGDLIVWVDARRRTA